MSQTDQEIIQIFKESGALLELFNIMAAVTIIIKDERLNTMLKLFLINTPIISIVKIERDKKISGNIIFKLSIIFIVN